MNLGQYNKAFFAGAGSLILWVQTNVEITEKAITIPLSPEMGAMTVALTGFVFGIWRVPNKAQD